MGSRPLTCTSMCWDYWYGLKKVLMSTYQSASGAGAEGMQELVDGHAAYAKDRVAPADPYQSHAVTLLR